MKRVYIGIDNGTSGTISVIGDDIETKIYHPPIKKEQNYTKAKKTISRLDCKEFLDIITQDKDAEVVVVMERPLVNPTRFVATTTALRCFEAQLILVEMMKYRIIYIDSKEWQKEMLPKGVKGSDELKKLSLDIGNRLFPQFRDFKHPDRDSLLICEYARRKNL